MAKKDRFTEILDEYRAKYDVDSLSSPNDQANLRSFINTQIMIETLQKKQEELAISGITANIDDFMKFNNAIEKLIENGLKLERALALDRKNRQQEKADSVAEYVSGLKIMARDFLERQYIRAECPNCKVLVGRIIPAIEHAAFNCSFQCSQCGKKITIKREERDPFFDFAISDRAWRKEHKYEVIQAKLNEAPLLSSDSELVIEDSEDEIGFTEETN